MVAKCWPEKHLDHSRGWGGGISRHYTQESLVIKHTTKIKNRGPEQRQLPFATNRSRSRQQFSSKKSFLMVLFSKGNSSIVDLIYRKTNTFRIKSIEKLDGIIFSHEKLLHGCSAEHSSPATIAVVVVVVVMVVIINTKF